jgi:hypothetical protein
MAVSGKMRRSSMELTLPLHSNHILKALFPVLTTDLLTPFIDLLEDVMLQQVPPLVVSPLSSNDRLLADNHLRSVFHPCNRAQSWRRAYQNRFHQTNVRSRGKHVQPDESAPLTCLRNSGSRISRMRLRLPQARQMACSQPYISERRKHSLARPAPLPGFPATRETTHKMTAINESTRSRNEEPGI